MAEYKKYSTDEKKAYGKQFSAKEKASYRAGQVNGFSRAGSNALREAKFFKQYAEAPASTTKSGKGK